jgi:hypothetical protein
MFKPSLFNYATRERWTSGGGAQVASARVDLDPHELIELTVLLFVRHETANELGDFIGGGIQGGGMQKPQPRLLVL